MTEQEFERIKQFLKSRYGIDMTGKKEIINGRLGNLLRKNGFASYTDYMNAVEKDSSGQMEKELVNLLSTNHTYFMREFEHLEFLKNEILPYLKKKEESRKDLRIWCGAASTGEEPYMLAMTLMDFFGVERSQWDTKILATDINTQVLSTALQGIYPKNAIDGLPEVWKKRYFKLQPSGDSYMVKPELKEQVLFRQFNLMNPFPFKKKMHVIFMRNVMIYFDPPTKHDLIQKLYNTLEPGGYLIVGTTETVNRENIPLEMIKPSIFRKPLNAR